MSDRTPPAPPPGPVGPPPPGPPPGFPPPPYPPPRRRRANGWILGGVLTVLVVLVATLTTVTWLASRHDDRTLAASARATSSYGLAIGDRSAPHHVVVYEDFLCPFCHQFETASHARLRKLAADGTAYVEYRPFHLLPTAYSETALEAFAVVQRAYPSGDVAARFHDLLYAHQPVETGPYPSRRQLLDWAVEAGADRTRVQRILRPGAGSEWASAATEQARHSGVSGTPTVVLDGRMFREGRTVPQMVDRLIAALQGAPRARSGDHSVVDRRDDRGTVTSRAS